MLDHEELSKYFSKEQQKDLIELERSSTKISSRKSRRPRTRKPKPGHIPRPVNSFMSYRTEKQLLIRKFCPHANHRDISRIVALWWHNIDSKEKMYYVSKAANAKTDHAEKYPDYVFRPKSKKQKKGTDAKTTSNESAKALYVESPADNKFIVTSQEYFYQTQPTNQVHKVQTTPTSEQNHPEGTKTDNIRYRFGYNEGLYENQILGHISNIRAYSPSDEEKEVKYRPSCRYGNSALGHPRLPLSGAECLTGDLYHSNPYLDHQEQVLGMSNHLIHPWLDYQSPYYSDFDMVHSELNSAILLNQGPIVTQPIETLPSFNSDYEGHPEKLTQDMPIHPLLENSYYTPSSQIMETPVLDYYQSPQENYSNYNFWQEGYLSPQVFSMPFVPQINPTYSSADDREEIYGLQPTDPIF